MSNVQRLAEALLADRNRERSERTDISACFMCGRGMLYRGNRFCSDRCRNFYDTGAPGTEQDWRHPKVIYRWRDGRPMKAGFLINCAHCRKEFDGLGLRCCSVECERALKERKDNLTVMAEVGMEPSVTKRQCETCGAKIPNWRNGRRVSKATRYCSPKCGQRARKAA